MKGRTIALGCALAIFFGYIVWRGAQRGNDFKYPYLAAQALWRTGRLHVWAQPRYPVTFHVLLAPLTVLPIGYAAAVWAILSFAAIAALPGVLEGLSGLSPRRQVLSWVVVLPCLLDALVLGQSDPINLFLVSAGLLAVQRRRSLAGVGLVGLAGMIKFLPILHWGTIVSRYRSRGVWAGMALSVGLGLGVIVAAVGWESALAGLGEQFVWIRDHEKPWHLVARQSDLRANNESLPVVLARTFGVLEGVKPEPHTVALGLVPLEVLWRAWLAILLVLAIVWLSCACVRPANESGRRRAWLGMFALSSVGMLAGTPICWHHYFLWLLPATLFLADRRRLLVASAVVSWVGTGLPLLRGLGGHMVLALGLFGVVAIDLRRLAREPRPPQSSPTRVEHRPPVLTTEKP
jgi:alpha-1,2-mannosyltransferase